MIPTKATMIFLNLLSFVAPTAWVLIAGALGFSVGAYGPRLLTRFKNDCFTRTQHPTDAATLPRRRTPSRPANPRRAASRPAASRSGRKRTSTR